MSLTIDQVNFLIYRYLSESGFESTGYKFLIESHLKLSQMIEWGGVPPQALLSILKQGIKYKEKVNASEEEEEEEEVSHRRHQVPQPAIQAVYMKDPVIPPTTSRSTMMGPSTSRDALNWGRVTWNIEIPKRRTTVWQGHTDHVNICTWHPFKDLLATGSEDATARIWNLHESSIGKIGRNRCLNHAVPFLRTKKDKVSSAHWHPKGTYLATSCDDGHARLWDCKGRLMGSFGSHEGGMTTVKWSKQGDFLLTGGKDNATILWEADTLRKLKRYKVHSGPGLVYSVDWESNYSYASCSTDKKIHICKFGIDKPVKSFKGHRNEVLDIKWDPRGELLASFSFDSTLKIWTPQQRSCIRNIHTGSSVLNAVEWSPTGVGTPNPNVESTLASAADDSTITLWEIERGVAIHKMMKHTKSAFSIAFSPNATLLASAGLDTFLYIWCTKTGQLVRSYKNTCSIGSVSWNFRGDKVAGSAADGSVFVLDLRTI